jgi:hypothetical protein|tara:strand:- start:246 stop:506 length:261 start_codon:yes stop_codon:yes gene_type:complete
VKQGGAKSICSFFQVYVFIINGLRCFRDGWEMVKTGPKMAQKPSEHLIECEINTSFTFGYVSNIPIRNYICSHLWFDLTEQMQTRR